MGCDLVDEQVPSNAPNPILIEREAVLGATAATAHAGWGALRFWRGASAKTMTTQLQQASASLASNPSGV